MKATALTLAVACVLLVGCSTPSFDKKALSDDATTLQSQAAEGALLASDAAAGKSSLTFVQQQARDLVGLESQLSRSLGAAQVDPALAHDLDGLRSLASRVGTDLTQLGADPGNLDALSRDLQQAADASERIGKGLS